ncbi:MAG: nucleotidyl transferase AbiEii/AbiGii toxin family protein, partial [Muribaculaceae bacterium]|nr:nucleotidyl transferase AbiEii/AbiGii toxin family protein [Muribaculaceae bacterium]
ALSNRKLYDAIVEHRKAYYALKYVNYDLHYHSTINFTIPELAMKAWQDDYADMRRFFIYGESLEFDALMQKMRELQERVRIM